MKILKKITFFAFAIFALTMSFSCSNNDSSDEDEIETTENFIKFKYKGASYSFDPGLVTSDAMNLMGFQGIDDTYKSVSLWMPLNATAGSHPIVYDLQSLNTTYQVEFKFLPEIGNAKVTSGTITITAIDSKKIQGTFNFSGTNEGTAFTVTDGSFNFYRF
ncbi:hypothetical protein OIU80_06505 [Flavobacterium sp. LS1R47]|jgi:hypothetical protein|uniref:DUF4251 domain-containing protein n=1 Tax=Flavobacterium frigoritolerans TaxID=2987686 RepID=A0A9X2ZQE6_9FLAO|nr:hypothetical protein [Flavobacterium frigoritolerans]MCV9931928.1 hypothetical protein [Flavobacterium frigoritolerans]